MSHAGRHSDRLAGHHGQGNQVFLDVNATPRNVPGVFELYTKELEGNRVLIGWRDAA